MGKEACEERLGQGKGQGEPPGRQRVGAASRSRVLPGAGASCGDSFDSCARKTALWPKAVLPQSVT